MWFLLSRRRSSVVQTAGAVPTHRRTPPGTVAEVATLDDVAAIALDLPGVDRGRSTRRSRVGRGRQDVRVGTRVQQGRPRRFGETTPPTSPILAVRVDDLGEKEAVLGAGNQGFFTIPHFDGYAAVLIELRLAGKRALREAIVDGWLACAPAPLAEAYVASHRRR